MYRIYVNQLFTLVKRLLVNSGPLVMFWGTQKLYSDFSLHGAGTPSPCIIQRSTVFNQIRRLELNKDFNNFVIKNENKWSKTPAPRIIH